MQSAVNIKLAIAQALNNLYIEPAKKLLIYKLNNLNALYKQDRFSMKPEQVDSLNKRIAYLSREVEVLNNLIDSSEHAMVAAVEQYEEIVNHYRARAEYWQHAAILLAEAYKDSIRSHSKTAAAA